MKSPADDPFPVPKRRELLMEPIAGENNQAEMETTPGPPIRRGAPVPPQNQRFAALAAARPERPQQDYPAASIEAFNANK